MQKRFVSIWFRYLTTDWLCIRKPELFHVPFVFAASIHNRKVITAVNSIAEADGILTGMPVADAKAMVPQLEVFDEKQDRNTKLLKAIGEWCIRYSPTVALDAPDGLVLDVTGCTHLWGGELQYLQELIHRFKSKGYYIQIAMADTVGAAWALARYGTNGSVVESGKQAEALLSLPPAALRLEIEVLQRLQKLGLYNIRSFISMPRSVLRRRFGEGMLQRLSQALGSEEEPLVSIHLVEPYQERLPCLEPIRTASGIEIAIQKLLESLCQRLYKESKGIRKVVLKCYRVDGRIEQVEIGTNKASHHIPHLFKLFELKISSIEPALGIELFVIEATKVEEISPSQEALWLENAGKNMEELSELLDRLSARIGSEAIHRYFPDEHFWPERSIQLASSIIDKPAVIWPTEKSRPTLLLSRPDKIEVTAPIPDYPPMTFRYKGKLHYVKKSDGPERIEREWWLEAGEHRDYFQVEDEEGKRYWLFRSGHYSDTDTSDWFIHGFFA
ncbi:Y-family DNA polymerase [Desertivirga arenae]|uniref:Y-family DNA polymerase n=1 Tax=Desertivirga arenae TaxID=2810309 RepID=UPI001A95A535|nr:DNA polymerase Y family protein [Pedobacter sp. SYSU D00823]